MSFCYKGLEAVKKIHIVTPEEVEKELQGLVERRPRITVITDRETRNGDQVLLDYAGFCDGEQFQGGTAQNQTLDLGSGTFIPGFEEQLVGHKAGDQVSVKVTFPKEYHAENLAGTEAEFKCTIHEIRELGKYELDETFAKEVGQCASVEEMREKMGRSMQYYQDEQAEINLQDELLKNAADTLEMEISQEQIQSAIDEQMDAVSAQLRQQGMSLELYCQFMQTTVEKLREQAEPAARQSILTAAAIEKIVELESLQAEPEEIKKAQQHIADRNAITLEQLLDMKDPSLDAMVERAVLTSKVMAVIRANAKVTEEK